MCLANSYWLSAATSAVALSLSVAGLAILYGQLGLVSLCQFALVGVGGWVTLRVGHAFHPPFEVSLLAGGVVASVVGLAFGLPALRLKGLYLALVTLMLAGAFQIIISAWGFPDGGDGFLGRADGSGRAMLSRPGIADGAVAYFLYVCLAATIGLLIAQWHKLGRPGRAWALIRKGETVAIASGVNVLTYKAWAFALSGFRAGIAGALNGDQLLKMAPLQRVRAGLRRSFQTEQVVEDLTVSNNLAAIADHVVAPLHRAAAVDAALVFTGLRSIADKLGQSLNLFQRRLVELGKCVIGNPKLILLDEPAAGLTEEEGNMFRELVLRIPSEIGAQVLVIDHDVELIRAMCSETMVLDYGKLLALGPTEIVLADPNVRRAYLGEF
jgi:ABC-type branched-subunit amino acid transport system ATPase component